MGKLTEQLSLLLSGDGPQFLVLVSSYTMGSVSGLLPIRVQSLHTVPVQYSAYAVIDPQYPEWQEKVALSHLVDLGLVLLVGAVLLAVMLPVAI